MTEILNFGDKFQKRESKISRKIRI